MPLKKTACRRSARVATRAKAAVSNQTKSSKSTPPSQMSKTGRLQARKSAINSDGPEASRRMPRYQEDSEREEWNRKSVPSDEAVEEETDSVVSAQGRERQNALRGDVELEVGNSFDFLPAPSRNARMHENSKNKEQPPDVYTARTHREPTASEWRAASEDEAYYRQPPASSWRDGTAGNVDDHSATASFWRGPRPPPASSWREAASIGQQEVRPLRQPPASSWREAASIGQQEVRPLRQPHAGARGWDSVRK